jgi:Alternative complex III, ActD subunit
MKRGTRIYGLLAEFDDPQALLDATKAARHEGYSRMEAYSPFSIDEVAKELGHGRGWIPYIVLLGGIIGGGGGFFMEWYSMAIDYPFNIGGRPLWSWPAFIPITFELTVLGAALFGALGMLALNRLPQPYHPVFNVERFGLATQNRFFLCIEARDPRFNLEETRTFLATTDPREVFDVED